MVLPAALQLPERRGNARGHRGLHLTQGCRSAALDLPCLIVRHLTGRLEQRAFAKTRRLRAGQPHARQKRNEAG